jgi:GAF domain-containing protein
MPLGIFHYQLLHRVLERIHLISDERDMAEEVLKDMAASLAAEGGAIFKVSPNGKIGVLASFGTSREALERISFEVGKGVVGWVAEHGESLKVDDPARDQRFQGEADAAVGFKTRNVVAAPIVAKDRIVGVIEFLNRTSGTFYAHDLEIVAVVGRELGVAFDNVRLIRFLEASKTFQDAIVDSLPACLIVDQNARLLRANPAAERLLNVDLQRGAQAPPKIDDVLKAFPPILAAAREMLVLDDPLPQRDARLLVEGVEKTVKVSCAPIVDRRGKRWGSLVLLHEAS